MTPVSAPTPGAVAQHDRSYVDWAAILAGTVIATSITLVLTGFGSAIGLSMTSTFAGKGLSGIAIAVATGLWVIWVAVTSLVAGSYITGRMRRRAGDASDTEVSIRDGAHGLVVWAVSALVGAIIATMTVGGVVKTGAEIARTGVSVVANIAGNSPEYAIDTLVRSEGQSPALDENTRQQIGRALVRAAADGGFKSEERTYLTRIVASRAGIEPVEVERRIDAYTTQAKEALSQARTAADKARRLAVLVAFLTAASLAVAGAGAWWGASLGGKHRDENTDLSHLMRW